MPGYRIYSFDRRSVIADMLEVAFDTDHEAMIEAYALCRECPSVEVWCGTRLVARVPNPLLCSRHEIALVQPSAQQAHPSAQQAIVAGRR